MKHVLFVVVALAGCAEVELSETESELQFWSDEQVREPSGCSVVFTREAVIAAPPEAVWDVLVDLEAYPSWNPWLLRAEGELTPGGAVEADVVMGDQVMHVDHVVLAVEPAQRLCWRDAGWNSLFVYGQRCRMLTPLPDGTTHFRQELLLDGALSIVAKWMYGTALESGIAAETAALQAQW